MSFPQNALERILADPRQGPESHPELFRLLRESTLVFLMPYHPEVMGTMSLKSGDALPKFARWKGKEGVCIPIFSSIERANQACKKIGARESEYALAEMKGQQLFALLACQKDTVMINPACGMPTTFMDLNAIKKLADGSILKPVEQEGRQKEGQVTIVEPANYPTDVIQPLFRFLRDRPEVKAAWLFREITPANATRISYVFVLKATTPSTQTQQDFGVVAHSACPKNMDFGVTFLDPDNAALVKITSKAIPFYAAPDYKAPNPLQDDEL